jgi:hypothetical protein
MQIQYTYSHSQGGESEPERRFYKGNSSQSLVENTNMTDYISSL